MTEHNPREEERRTSERRFRTAFERAPLGMALVAVDGGWLEVNLAFRTFLGYAKDELRQTTWQALTHPSDLDPDLASVEATLAGHLEGFAVEKRYLRKNGDAALGRITVALVRSTDGKPCYFICQLEDISAPQRLAWSRPGSGGGSRR